LCTERDVAYDPHVYSVFNEVKAIPVTCREGRRVVRRRGSDIRLTDGGKFVSLIRRPPFTTKEDSRYSFLLETQSSPGP
jgi:hypothetical protein